MISMLNHRAPIMLSITFSLPLGEFKNGMCYNTTVADPSGVGGLPPRGLFLLVSIMKVPAYLDPTPPLEEFRPRTSSPPPPRRIRRSAPGNYSTSLLSLMNRHLLRTNSLKTVYVFRIVKQGLGTLCQWNIGDDCIALIAQPTGGRPTVHAARVAGGGGHWLDQGGTCRRGGGGGKWSKWVIFF